MEERFNSLSILKINSLSHIGKQERFNSSRHIEKKDFNSLSHIEKRFIKRGSILWVLYKEFHSLSLFFFFDTRFNSLSHISWSNVSILCVIWKKKVFISLRHIQRKGFNSLRRIERKRVQLFAYLKKRVEIFDSY